MFRRLSTWAAVLSLLASPALAATADDLNAAVFRAPVEGNFQLASVHVGKRGPGHLSRVLGGAVAVVPPNFDPNPGFFVNASTQIGTASGTALGGGVADTKKTTVAFWSLAYWDPTAFNNAQGNTVLLGELAGSCEPTGTNAAPFCFAWVDNSGSGNYAQWNINTATQGVDFNYDNAMIPGVWTFNIITLDTANQAIAVYRNRTKMASVGGNPTIPLNMNIALTTASGLGIMNRNTSAVKWMMLENFYLSSESSVCISTADLVLNGNHFPCPGGANTIPATLLDKFIDASTLKAIDLGADGSVVTGRRPEILLSGNAASATVNKGFATGLGLRAAAGNALGDQAVWESPFGPGQTLTAHQPTSKWMPVFASSSLATVSCPSTCIMPVSTGGQPVAVGDLIVITAQMVDLAGTLNRAIGCPVGFTSANGGPVLDTRNEISVNLCYRFATDATSTWNLSFVGPVTGIQTHGWMVMDYQQVASVDIHTCAVQSLAATWNTPTVSTASNNETVLSLFHEWDNGFRYFGTAPATIRWQPPKSKADANILATDAFYPASGSATSKAATFASGSDSGVVCSLGMVGT